MLFKMLHSEEWVFPLKIWQSLDYFVFKDYSWEDHGYSLVNRLYPDVGQLIDEKFQIAYNLTYNTMAMHKDVDTSMLRRAIWNYIHCMFGIRLVILHSFCIRSTSFRIICLLLLSVVSMTNCTHGNNIRRRGKKEILKLRIGKQLEQGGGNASRRGGGKWKRQVVPEIHSKH